MASNLLYNKLSEVLDPETLYAFTGNDESGLSKMPNTVAVMWADTLIDVYWYDQVIMTVHRDKVVLKGDIRFVTSAKRWATLMRSVGIAMHVETSTSGWAVSFQGEAFQEYNPVPGLTITF